MSAALGPNISGMYNYYSFHTYNSVAGIYNSVANFSPRRYNYIWYSLQALYYSLTAVEQCQKRWKALRERFAREAKKKTKSGDPADNTPPWSYFELLQYLKEFVEHGR